MAICSVIAYFALFLFIRISGKRTLSKINAFDVVVTITLGSTLSSMMLATVTLAEGTVGGGEGTLGVASRLNADTVFRAETPMELAALFYRKLPPDAKVWVFGNEITLVFQQAYGSLRRDIELRSEGSGSEWAVVLMWRGVMSPEFVAELENTRPAYALELQGVPLVAIYRLGAPMPTPEDRPQ